MWEWGGQEGAHSVAALLSRLTIDHVSLSRWSTEAAGGRGREGWEGWRLKKYDEEKQENW